MKSGPGCHLYEHSVTAWPSSFLVCFKAPSKLLIGPWPQVALQLEGTPRSDHRVLPAFRERASHLRQVTIFAFKALKEK